MLGVHHKSVCATMVALGRGLMLMPGAFAATSANSTIDVLALQQALSTRNAVTSGKSQLGASLPSSNPAEIYVNPNRAYPPSCLSDGLPYGQFAKDPNLRQAQISLPVYDSTTGTYDASELDTFTVWRVPCSGGTSATLLQIDRPSGSNGNVSLYPIFPDISVTANGSTTVAYPRLPKDPNTVYSDTELTSPIVFSAVYVLEYYNANASLSGSSSVDYNQAFTLGVNNYSGGSPITLSIPAYSAANFSNYPSASNPMEISGYLSGGWYDPAHSGEGMFIQVFDDGDQLTRTLTATWYTFDQLGAPVWLYSQGSVNIGDTQLNNAQVAYLTGGGFAGSGGAATLNPWGTMSFSFPDCGHLTVTYKSTDTNLPNGPTGSGTLNWIRVGNINGLVCQ